MLRFERREEGAARSWLLPPLLALAFTLAVGALLVAWAGAPVGRSYLLLLEGAFGSRFALTETLTRATPLILTGLAVAVAFRARLFNIGAEGQLYLGALATVYVSSLLGAEGLGLSAIWLGLACVLAALLAGGLLMAIPAWLKYRLAVDEVVTTLLLNFIVLLFVSAMLDGPMKDPAAMGWPQSVAIDPALELPRLIERSRLHAGFIIAVLLMLLLEWIDRRTVFGLQTRAVGSNARAARFLGLPVPRVLLVTALLSGGLAGLAGFVEVTGRATYLTLDMSPGYGYSGIVIAMLAGLSPLGVVLGAIFVAGILVGADSMSRAVGVPSYLADVLVAVALLAMLVATLAARYRLRRVRPTASPLSRTPG